MPHYFVLESLPHRVSDDSLEAVLVHRDGSEELVDPYKVVNEGREISKAEFDRYWADNPDE